MAEELDYRRVLRRCISRLKEDLEPESILDQFTECDFLSSTTIRDIRELPTTTKKNEAIINEVLTKGIKGYKQFKRLLRKSYQAHLAEVLERMEKEVQKDQQSKSGLNLDARGSQHNPVRSTTYNYGGPDSMNMFGGNMNVNSDISFGGNRTHPTSGQNNPGITARNPGAPLPNYGQSNPGMTERYPGAHSSEDPNAGRRSDGVGTMNLGGHNAFNLFGGQVTLQGNLNFGGGPLGLSHVMHPGYQVSNNNNNPWNNQNRSREQGQHGNLQNLQTQFSQFTIQNHEGSPTRHVPQYTEPNNRGYDSNYLPEGSGNKTRPTSGQNNPGITARYPEAHLLNYGQSNPGMTARYSEAPLPIYQLPNYGQSNPGMTARYSEPPLPIYQLPNYGQSNPGMTARYSEPPLPIYQLPNYGQSNPGMTERYPGAHSSEHPNGIQGRVRQPEMQPHPEFSSHRSFGQTQAESTSVQHIGKVPMEEDHRTFAVQLDENQFNDRHQSSIQQDQTKDTHINQQLPSTHLIGQVPVQSMSRQQEANALVINNQRPQRGEQDVSLQDRRLQDSNHHDETLVEGEQQRDETDAAEIEENANVGNRITGLSSVTRHETVEKPQDVDDGRVIDVPLEWLNSVLEMEPFSSGKSGEVFKSKEVITEWKMEIAVKKIERTKYNSRAAQNEVIAARLRHHAIVPLLGRCLEDEQFYYFIFPYMESGNLRHAIKQDLENEGLRMDVLKRVFILYKISCAILYIHTEVQDLRSKMVHGDITTTNIVLDWNYSPRLLDFGVARSLKDEDSVPVKTGDQIGAYTTMVADKRLSLETDYRSFGVVILEMLTGADDPRELKNRNLKVLEKIYGSCFEKVWKNNEGIYKDLKELAGKCREGKVNAIQIAEELCNVLNNTIGYDWSMPKDEKCSQCLINPAVEDPDFNLHFENCQEASCRMTMLNVCVACMRNSYLNPIQCLACRKTIHTKIGSCWAAILITGFDETDQSVFQQDTWLMWKTLTSRYPLITGLSAENVYRIEMNDLEKTVEMLNDKDFINSVFIYYSGHYYKDKGKGFQTHEDRFTSKEEFGKYLNALERDIILVTDCCFSGELRYICPYIRIQIGASGSEETAEFNQSGSILTKFFVHSLTGKSQGLPCPLTDNTACDICKKYNPAEKKIGFICGREMFRNIEKHMKEYYIKGPHKGCRPLLYIRDGNDDCFIGYHIDKKTEIKFGIVDNIESKQPADEFVISELPEEMKNLQMILFREVLKQKNVDVNTHKGLWEKHCDVITVIVREGPRTKDEIELHTVAKVSDAVIQKFDISCRLRPIEKLNEGKAGMFLTDGTLGKKDVTIGKVVECASKINHDGLKVQKGEKEYVITIDWENIKDWSVVEAVRETCAETWLEKCLSDIAEKNDNMEAKELVMTAPFGGCSSICENFLVIEIRKEETS